MREVELNISVIADNAIHWQDGSLYLLDQRQLPHREIFIQCRDASETAEAIQAMVVRGAPAIGITAAYGVVLAAALRMQEDRANWRKLIAADLQVLQASRPTAINLFWAINRLRQLIDRVDDGNALAEMLAEAQHIHQKDKSDNRKMGDYGAALIEQPTAVITHCNAGALATGGYGTALGVIRSGFAQGKIQRVYADETRPWMQGARLTAWELIRDDIPVSLIVEGAAAACMQGGNVGWVIVGSDRIAANGDVANKIGTYGLAVMARYHGLKFMVAAPTSTIDMQTPAGDQIPIEQRDYAEVLQCRGGRIAAQGSDAWNPVFDVTPADLVDAIVTEKGVVLKPDADKIASLMARR